MIAAALELALPPEALSRIARLPGLVPHGRAEPFRCCWYDTPDGSLAGRGLAVCERDGVQRLKPLRPGRTEWPAVTPVPVLAEAACLPEAEGMAEVTHLTGRRQHFVAGTVAVDAMQGKACGQPVGRVLLTGPAVALADLAVALSDGAGACVPRESLSAEAIRLATAMPRLPRHLGAPQAVPGQSVPDCLAGIAAHLVDVMLHWTDQVGTAPEEPVHQGRVAIRRLRSALSVFRRAVPSAELDGLRLALKDVAARLGSARDWDVFLDGTGAALPVDQRCAVVLRAARKRRAEAYAALGPYLSGPEFRGLTVRLACTAALRSWAQEPALPVEPFAATVLDKRLKVVRRGAKGLSGLPAPALHELRKDCKRLRYAAEFFAPLFPHRHAKRFVARLATLQDRLGRVNDAAATEALMAQLGRAGRGYGAGLATGLALAAGEAGRAEVAGAWSGFRAARPFWHPAS